MSEIGWKSSASAAMARSHDGGSSSDTPCSIASARVAALRRRRHAAEGDAGLHAMRRPSSVNLKAAITAEISWSKRLEIL